MSDSDHHFESADAGSSLVYPMQAGSLRKGGHCMLKGKPCKITEISISKTGKHGHAKAHIVGNDIFTGKKYEDLCPTSHNMEVPNVNRVEYQLLNVNEDDGQVSCLMDNGETKDDLNLPKDTNGNYEEHAEAIIKAFNDGKDLTVTVLCAMDQEKIDGYKEQNPKA